VLAVVAASCSHHSPRANRIIASPSPTSVAGLETPLPSPSPTPSPSSRSAASVSFSTPKPAARTPAPDLSKVHITLTRIASLSEPVTMAVRSNDSALYFAERKGTIRAVRGGSVDPIPVLDITSEVQSGYTEQGLLGLTFSPDGSHMYVYFTHTVLNSSNSDIVVREYAFSGGRAVTSTSRDLITIQHRQFPNHDGGNIAFGSDGYLYIGTGDGGSGGDPLGNAQNVNALLGKLLRIDPKAGSPNCGNGSYTIPPTNPFVGRTGCDEIWAYGLRNPWRYSFDRATHDLWIGDVGQDSWEEVDLQSASGRGGDNYGWNRMEGTHSYNGGTPPPSYHGPIYEYSHAGGNCSITGGFVYRGTRIHNLVGSYVFGDYCVGQIEAFDLHNGQAADHRFMGPQVSQLSSFGQDANGELYALSLGGAVYRIDPA
jgi:glucose/arabinose dehydrogenase